MYYETEQSCLIFKTLCDYNILLLTDAKAFPISSPELPGIAPRFAKWRGEQSNNHQLG